MLGIGGIPFGLPDSVHVEDAYYFEQPKPNAAGNTITRWTVPGNGYWLPLSLFCRYSTDATVANRTVRLTFTDGDGNILLRLPASAPQAASLDEFYSWTGQSSVAYGSAAAHDFVIPLPPLPLPPGWRLQLDADNGVAGDVFLVVRLAVVVLPTGPVSRRSTPAGAFLPVAI